MFTTAKTRKAAMSANRTLKPSRTRNARKIEPFPIVARYTVCMYVYILK
jgi:hypothetical protein